MRDEEMKTHCSQKELQCKQLDDEKRKTLCSHKKLRFKQWVMKEDSSFTQGFTMQTMGNEERKTRSYNANNG
ncbi:hypothetical protein KSS87_010529 [Heliosperma pusillum]|nr:hypothetical protein KSS87_010529 [Heliosperma pusillum]